MANSESLPQHMARLIQNQSGSLEQMYRIAKSVYGYDKGFSTFRKYVANLRWRLGLDEPQPESDKNQESMDQQLQLQLQLPQSGTRDSSEPSNDEVFLELLQRNDVLNLYDVCETLECYPRVISEMVDDLRSQGFEIYFENNMLSLSSRVVGGAERVGQLEDREIIYGVASDLHFGSSACQITALKEFAEICASRGVKHIFCPGDIVAGYKVYPGQEQDVYAYTSKEQEDSVMCNLPEGFQWYMLGGNHDYTFISKGGGHNVIRALANRRDDIHYVGFDDATIPILDGVDLQMWHPSGGVPYSHSYRVQKGAEQIAFSELRSVVSGAKEKPTIRFLLAGHLHIQMQVMIGSMFAMQCGCFEGQTNYLRRKALIPNIGGYIVEASLNPGGRLRNFDAKFHLFEEIENDWTNYSHTVRDDSDIEGPVFE